MQNIDHSVIKVSAGIFIHDDEILISKRLDNQSWGGYWEFPGGKVEEGETFESCLKREIFEELGVVIHSFKKWITREFEQDGKNIQIVFFKIFSWQGRFENKDVADHKWIKINEAHHFSEKILPKNLYILRALKLPPLYLITNYFENKFFIDQIDKIKTSYYLQLREPDINEAELVHLIDKIKSTRVEKTIINSRHVNLKNKFDGIHFTNNDLKNLEINTFFGIRSASVHDISGIELAEKYKLDFVVLSPVKKTKSHPEKKPIGWNFFRTIANKSNIPVYALGGMKIDDMETAHANGAIGISSQRGFW
jgi:8-oxo-dGTP diphosphatase